MDIGEFQRVKNMTYRGYCDYLQHKYGIGLADYMTENYVVNKACKRTSEGLIAHHKQEDRAILLSMKEYARKNPIKWQSRENIVYCDFLEHLLLHVLICKYPNPANQNEKVGIGGVLGYLVPELNDVYSGYKSDDEWRNRCYHRVSQDKDVYLEIIKMFLEYVQDNDLGDDRLLMRSFNASYGKWDNKNNVALYSLFHNIWENISERVERTDFEHKPNPVVILGEPLCAYYFSPSDENYVGGLAASVWEDPILKVYATNEREAKRLAHRFCRQHLGDDYAGYDSLESYSAKDIERIFKGRIDYVIAPKGCLEKIRELENKAEFDTELER